MGDILIVDKPDVVSFEDIHNLLYMAHERNRSRGFIVKTAEMTGYSLEKHIGANGHCFVAMDADKLIGVTAVRTIERNNRFASGRIADQILVAVHPDYMGRHISSRLHYAVIQYCRDNDLAQIELRTAADNKTMQTACLNWGFSYVDFKAFQGIDHYTVVMMKWLGPCPYTSNQMKRYYMLRKFKVKLRYKEGKVKRFGI